jgi:hypothetical protein
LWLALPLAHAGVSTAVQGPNRLGFTNFAANFETGRGKAWGKRLSSWGRQGPASGSIWQGFPQAGDWPIFPHGFLLFPQVRSEKPFADKGFQRFPKFPQPLRLRFKFFLKRFLIRFSRWKKRLAASQALLHTDPACEKVTKLREGSKNQ